MSITNGNSIYNSGLDQNQVEAIVDNKIDRLPPVYHAKGSANVSTINGMTTQQEGDAYQLTDAGTINPGSVNVVAGDIVVWNGSVWFKVAHDFLLEDNIAEAFDPNKVNGADGYAYHAGDVVTYDGRTYRFRYNVPSGAWNSSNVLTYLLRQAVTSCTSYEENLGLTLDFVGQDFTLLTKRVQLIPGLTYSASSRNWVPPSSGIAIGILLEKTDSTTEQVASKTVIPFGESLVFSIPSSGYTGWARVRIRAASGNACKIVVSAVGGSSRLDDIERRLTALEQA